MKDQILDAISAILSADETRDRTALKGRFLDLARAGQTTPDSDLLLEVVALGMVPEIRALFGPMSLLVPLTEPLRRQVYFAAIAALVRDGRIQPRRSCSAVRAEQGSRFLTLGNEALIAWAFGSCPTGFIRALSRLGERAADADLYLELHEMLIADPALGREMPILLDKNGLKRGFLALLRKMPRTAEGRRVAAIFGDVSSYEEFMKPYEAVTGHTGGISREHVQRLLSGEHPHKLIRDIYRRTPFAPAVVTHPEVTHLASWEDLRQTSLEFSNCLRSFLDEAVRGTHQFYVWRPKDGEPAVFQLNSDGPFGWYLAEVKRAENENLDEEAYLRLRALLKGCGVHRNLQVESIMHRISWFEDDDDDDGLEDLARLFGEEFEERAAA